MIHVEHLPRMSSFEARLVDRLSRRSTSTRGDVSLLETYGQGELPVFLKDWLKNPGEDWSIVTKLINFVSNKC